MTQAPALELRGISKNFGTVTALDDASLVIEKGTVHALLGENGAGKTTLMNIAFGALRADSGRVYVNDSDLTAFSPRDAIEAGVGMVHQHFTNVPAMTVAENVALGGAGRFDRAEWTERVREIGRTTGLVLDPNARARDLPVSAQQRLEVVKAFARNARVLVLDEPTAVLTGDEARGLLGHLRSFVAGGGSVVLITHKLREALAFADAATVLRRGRTVMSVPIGQATESLLASAMLGEEESGQQLSAVSYQPSAVSEQREAFPTPKRDVAVRCAAISVKDARGTVKVDNVSFEVHRGEILGIAAAEGAGQHELLLALAGRLPLAAGTLTAPHSIGFIPEDRQGEGLILDFPLYENLALRGAGALKGTIQWRDIRRRTASLIEAHDVRASSPDASANSLSGGNQQRFVLARELEESPELLVAENPTRGLDIRATALVHDRLRAAKRDFAAVILYSSDLDEVVALSDRVLVMYAGSVRDVGLDRGAIGRAMVGAGGAA